MSGFSDSVFANRRYAVVGLGRAGLASMHALTSMGATVVGWDDAPFARDTALRDGLTIEDPTADIGDYDALVLSPGIPHALPVPHRIAAATQRAGRPILTDAELLFQAVRASGSNARFVGITGTNGKSTTTALLAHILARAGVSHAAGANLGPAALSLPLLDDSGVYVLEMSSYMLERLATLRFDAACMLNLSPDHLDRHGDMANYMAAKRRIFERQQTGDAVIIGIDDDLSAGLANEIERTNDGAHVTRISGHQRADVWCHLGIIRDQAGPIAELAAAHALPGVHNAQNAAAAAALAAALGMTREDVASGIETFPGLPHRQQVAGVVDGVRFVNDSKATNADAAGRALTCYDRVVWIAGGIAKAGGIESLASVFSRVAEALLVGRDAAIFAETLSLHGVAHRVVDTLDQAVAAALPSAKARGADTILLSPACASFDQFSGFEERGDRFIALVHALERKAA